MESNFKDGKISERQSQIFNYSISIKNKSILFYYFGIQFSIPTNLLNYLVTSFIHFLYNHNFMRLSFPVFCAVKKPNGDSRGHKYAAGSCIISINLSIKESVLSHCHFWWIWGHSNVLWYYLHLSIYSLSHFFLSLSLSLSLSLYPCDKLWRRAPWLVLKFSRIFLTSHPAPLGMFLAGHIWQPVRGGG